MDIWYTFNKLLRPIYGTGLGRLPGLESLYLLLYKTLSNNRTLKIQGLELEMGTQGHISAVTLALRQWEAFELELFLESLKSGTTVVDVGASFGFYTCLAARAVGSSGRVYAFEPFEPTYDLLLKNIDRNGLKNVIPSSKAVSKETGWIDTYINRSQEGVMPSGTILVQVPCISLDDALTSPIDVVKIDAEGYDLHVVQGMERLIEENKNLLLFIEVSPKGLESVGSSMSLLLETLERSFVSYLIKEKGETLEPVDSSHRNIIDECSGPIGTANLYCKRKS